MALMYKPNVVRILIHCLYRSSTSGPGFPHKISKYIDGYRVTHVRTACRCCHRLRYPYMGPSRLANNGVRDQMRAAVRGHDYISIGLQETSAQHHPAADICRLGYFNGCLAQKEKF